MNCVKKHWNIFQQYHIMTQPKNALELITDRVKGQLSDSDLTSQEIELLTKVGLKLIAIATNTNQMEAGHILAELDVTPEKRREIMDLIIHAKSCLPS